MRGIEKIEFRGDSLDVDNLPCSELLDLISSGIFILDLDRKIKYLNEMMIRTSKMSKEYFIDHEFISVARGIEISLLDGLFDQVNKTKLVQKKKNVKHNYRPGEYSHIDIYVFPYLDRQDKLIGYVVLVESASLDHKYFLSAYRTNVFVRYVVDAMLEGATVIDEQGRLEYANKKFYELAGYEPEEILGKHWTYWCHEDDLTVVDNQKIIKNEIISNGVSKYQLRIRRKDGTYLPVMLLVSKPDNNQYNIMSIGLITDISETLRLETDYRQISILNKKILETIPTAIITLDRDLLIRSVNSRVENIFDRQIDQIRGMRLEDVFPEVQIFSEWSGWVLRSLKPYQVDRYKLNLASGRGAMFVNVRINPLLDQDREVNGVVCAFDDVTSSALLEEKIEASYRKLEVTHNKLTKLLARQRDFLADVSHELRTPITVILGNVEVAMQDRYIKYDELISVLHLVESEAKRMSSLVGDLMTLAKMEGGEIKLNYSRFYVTDILEGMQSKINVIAGRKRKIIIEPVEKLLVWGDKYRIAALLWNLIENAIKFSQKNGQININIYQSLKHAENLVIKVADNGAGIPPDQLEDIFERFYRIDKTRNRAKGGSGLGLSICKWTAEAHRGYIKVKSKLKEGSVFTVVLPIVVQD
ncbi:MAG: ATP-binding protein [Patescibacteria group bacterium]